MRPNIPCAFVLLATIARIHAASIDMAELERVRAELDAKWQHSVEVAPIGPMHGAVWTGTEFLLWDGTRGWALDPHSNTWRKISTKDDRIDSRPSLVKSGDDEILAAYVRDNKLRIDRYSVGKDKWKSLQRFDVSDLKLEIEKKFTPSLCPPVGVRLSNATLFLINTNTVQLRGVKITDDGIASVIAISDNALGYHYDDMFAHYANGKVYCWGYLHVMSNGGAIWDEKTDQWIAMAMGPIGVRRRYSFSHCFTGSEALVSGGAESSAFGWIVADNSAYSLSSNSWRSLADTGAPEPRRDACMCWTGQQAFVWGGEGGRTIHQRDQENHTPLDTGGLYDPKTDSWELLPKAPENFAARTSADCVWTGNEVIVWGGAWYPELFSDGAAYDPTKKTWRKLADVPSQK